MLTLNLAGNLVANEADQTSERVDESHLKYAVDMEIPRFCDDCYTRRAGGN